MAKPKKKAETQRWRIECPRCDKECPSAVKKYAKHVVVSFECHECGFSDDVRFSGEEAKKFK